MPGILLHGVNLFNDLERNLKKKKTYKLNAGSNPREDISVAVEIRHVIITIK
jgi:hypothetical protein